MNLLHLFPKRRFQKSFIWGYLFHCTFVRREVQLKSQQWFHFSFHFVPDILWRSKANWWWLRCRKLRSSKLGALRISLRKIFFWNKNHRNMCGHKKTNLRSYQKCGSFFSPAMRHHVIHHYLFSSHFQNYWQAVSGVDWIILQFGRFSII